MSPIDAVSAALDTIITRYAAMMRRVGFRHGLAEADVEEVMQDVRLRLWRAQSAEQIRGVSTSYVYRTAVSAALDLIRRRRARAREEPMTDVAGEAQLAATERASDPLEAEELLRQVEHAIEAIAATRRPVVRMYLAGYDRAEIAQLLGWTEAKTRNLLYRGLSDLRTLLNVAGVGPEART
jgi:RNA polymerase sigma factor (sigma-70 family)